MRSVTTLLPLPALIFQVTSCSCLSEPKLLVPNLPVNVRLLLLGWELRERGDCHILFLSQHPAQCLTTAGALNMDGCWKMLLPLLSG